MPRVSAHYLQERREEIIAACARLYETMSFKDITIKEIGKATSFTRTSIYNYFRTKEEIFLALMQREYEAWTADLNAWQIVHRLSRGMDWLRPWPALWKSGSAC